MSSRITRRDSIKDTLKSGAALAVATELTKVLPSDSGNLAASAEPDADLAEGDR